MPSDGIDAEVRGQDHRSFHSSIPTPNIVGSNMDQRIGRDCLFFNTGFSCLEMGDSKKLLEGDPLSGQSRPRRMATAIAADRFSTPSFV